MAEIDAEKLLKVIEKEREVLGELRKSEARRTREYAKMAEQEQKRAEEIERKADLLQSKVDMLTDILKGTKTTGDSLSKRLYWLNWFVALGTLALAIVGVMNFWVQLFNN